MNILKSFLLVAVGGAVGSMLRYAFTLMANITLISGQWATLAVNIIGSFLIGLLTACCQTQTWALLLIVGLCGGFTTYSTFSLQTLLLIKEGQVGLGLLYAFGTLALCLAFTYIGWWVKQ